MPTTSRSATPAFRGFLAARGKYLPSSRSRRRRVDSGKAAGAVMTAWSSRLGHGHVRGGPMAGSTRARTSLAVATLRSRFWITASTVTVAWLSCQTS